MQQGAGDLRAPLLAARERAGLDARAVRKADERQNLADPPIAARPPIPVQRRVIAQVLAQRQVEVQRPALEHHPDPRQRLPGWRRASKPATSILPHVQL